MPKVNKRGGKLVDPAQAAGVLEKEADGDFGLVQTAVDNINIRINEVRPELQGKGRYNRKEAL